MAGLSCGVARADLRRTRRRSWLGRAQIAIAVAGALSGGCSLVAVRRAPPSPPAGAPLECTRSRTAPVLDTAGAIAAPLTGLVAYGLCAFTSSMQSWSSDPAHVECSPVIWGTALATGAYAGSAVYGYRATARCRRMKAARDAAEPPGNRWDDPPARALPQSLRPGEPRPRRTASGAAPDGTEALRSTAPSSTRGGR